ncbi:MAG: hypothetical protein VYA89_00530 [Actinomycetota bacterium]|nr:hypothetical protein [Actinomycetota bacterium]
MIIRVSASGDVRVDEDDMFNDFRVEAPVGMAGQDLAATMGEGTRADGDYLWIAEAAVRHWAGRAHRDADDAWNEGFSGMVDYARSKGFTDPSGTHLRAHVEHSD